MISANVYALQQFQGISSNVRNMNRRTYGIYYIPLNQQGLTMTLNLCHIRLGSRMPSRYIQIQCWHLYQIIQAALCLYNLLLYS